MRQDIRRLQKRIDELELFDPQCVADGDDPKLLGIETAIKQTLSDVFGHESADWQLYKAASDLDPRARARGSASMGSRLNGDGSYQRGRPDYKRDVVESVTGGKQRALGLLRQAISGLDERIEYTGGNAQRTVKSGNKVFIVHGHDEGAREAVARFLEKIGFQAIVLHEQANQGRTVIEKVEAHGDVAFAVVLLTPDDEGCKKGGTSAPRARQNVLLELGYFVGRLGRKNVCALKRGDLEIPSDFGGVVYESFDESGGWRQALGRELQAAGYEVDWKKGMGP